MWNLGVRVSKMATKTEVKLKEKQARALERVEQLDQRIARLKAKSGGVSERTKRRKMDTKFKIMVGAAIMDFWKEKGSLESTLNGLFDRQLRLERLSASDRDFLRSMGVDLPFEED